VASCRSSRHLLQPAIARLDAPGPHHHDLNDYEADHHPDHARQLVGEPITANLVVGLVAVFAGIGIATTEGGKG
jgi:hypothetical protein